MGKVGVQVRYENGRTGWIYADYKDTVADGKIDATEQKRALDAAQKYIKDHKISGVKFFPDTAGSDVDKIDVQAHDEGKAWQQIVASKPWQTSVTKLFGDPIPKDELTSLDGPPLTKGDVDKLRAIVKPAANDTNFDSLQAKYARAQLLICIYESKTIQEFVTRIQKIAQKVGESPVTDEIVRKWHNNETITLPKSESGQLVADSAVNDSQILRALRRCPDSKLASRLADIYDGILGAVRRSHDAAFVTERILKDKGINPVALVSDKDFLDKSILTPMKVEFVRQILNLLAKTEPQRFNLGGNGKFDRDETLEIIRAYVNIVQLFDVARQAKD